MPPAAAEAGQAMSTRDCQRTSDRHGRGPPDPVHALGADDGARVRAGQLHAGAEGAADAAADDELAAPGLPAGSGSARLGATNVASARPSGPSAIGGPFAARVPDRTMTLGPRRGESCRLNRPTEHHLFGTLVALERERGDTRRARVAASDDRFPALRRPQRTRATFAAARAFS